MADTLGMETTAKKFSPVRIWQGICDHVHTGTLLGTFNCRIVQTSETEFIVEKERPDACGVLGWETEYESSHLAKAVVLKGLLHGNVIPVKPSYQVANDNL